MRTCLAAVVAICSIAPALAQDKNPYRRVDGDVRLEALRRAQVWSPGDIASRDIKAGPQSSGAFRPEAEVRCAYVEEKQRGTPKFDCKLESGDVVRVKYGEGNGEIYSEVAASRLLWALGFGADAVYPVRVICDGCPADPIRNHKRAAGSREFEAAVIERKLPGDEVELRKDSGWSWVELTFVDQTSGGAPLAHRHALTLLAAMIQHTDTKPQQQRLVCLDRTKGLEPDEDGRCQHPMMTVNDLGKTFGRATMTNADRPSAVNFEAWSTTPVWKGEEGCVAQLSKSFTGSLENPKISESGRQFLADLLNQLTDGQLRDLFEVARFRLRQPDVSIDEWVTAFKAKRDAISDRRCTNPVL